ncbi:MAG: TRAP transporter large permease subunit [Deltaproteobacteria bacterium]|uniref:TRAP transporter large permease n=1 Tax=Desulfobacula sp. TaxID=2593537 RepID=UPI0019B5289A|nr:TRAP transporter large permease subunit [Candidatus Desulfobacula maris]MBL6992979.1 TRAP transporter large permease subunit [Desulfobacula sp.]
MSINEMYAIAMVVALLGGVVIGFPVAFLMAGLGLFFGALVNGIDLAAYQATLNTYGVMSGWSLLAIPLFVYMGVVLEKAQIAEKLYLGLYLLLGPVRGGLAIATMFIATMFAACTGIAGASVIAIGLIALPSMLHYGYDKKMASGAICAGGGLGVIIPPSIMMILYGPVAGISISMLFMAAILPGILMASLYIIYMAAMCYFKPELGPAISKEEAAKYTRKEVFKIILVSGVPPMGLVFFVLGSIFFGVAAPTEAAAIGGLGALGIAAMYGKLNIKMILETGYSALKISTFIMWLVLGAKFFMTTFNKLGGGNLIFDALMGLSVGPTMLLIIMLSIIFILGMFMDWIGILLVVIPIFVPIVKSMGWDPLWFAMMFCITLQISYITPPFAYSIFYLKGIAPPEVTLMDIYRGCVPFIIIQFLVLIILFFWHDLALYLPEISMINK